MFQEPSLFYVAVILIIIYFAVTIYVVLDLSRIVHYQEQVSPATPPTTTPSEVPGTGVGILDMPGPPLLSRKPILLITKCSSPSMWYANLIGTKVPYEGFWPGEGYKSREPAGYVNIVIFEDARIIWESVDE